MENNVLKDVPISGASYRICKMSAKTGSWLLMQLMGKMVDVMQKAAASAEQTTTPEPQEDEKTKAGNIEAAANAAINYMLMNMDEDLFTTVQRHALAVCYRLESAGPSLVPMPVVTHTGAFAIKELEFDIDTVMQLTSHSLLANLSPFFSGKRLTGLANG